MWLYILLFGLPCIAVVLYIFNYLVKRRDILALNGLGCLGVLSLLLPVLFLLTMDINEKNDCCSDSAVFSPDHRLSVYLLVIICVLAYFYSITKTSIGSPVWEVITNAFLVIGIVLNVFIAIQVKEWLLWLPGNVPILLLFLVALLRNHVLFIRTYEEHQAQPRNRLEQIAWQLLTLPLLYKVPLLFILCFPILLVVAALLMLFGQKPDSVIQAFTQTYKHGLSQIDYQCDEVRCDDGHYLCTIAAKGHPQLVRPIRLGIRGGQTIICNRQLLISNAFEELLQQKLPSLHRPVRRLYNRIGNRIHQYYGLFNHKWVSDTIYILMKPLEWFFLLVLYTFDKKPEDRIAQQYFSKVHKQQLNRG